MRFRALGVVALAAMLMLAFAPRAGALAVGDKAPDFALTSSDGQPVKLADLTAKGPVVIYTFIQAFTGV